MLTPFTKILLGILAITVLSGELNVYAAFGLGALAFLLYCRFQQWYVNRYESSPVLEKLLSDQVPLRKKNRRKGNNVYHGSIITGPEDEAQLVQVQSKHTRWR